MEIRGIVIRIFPSKSQEELILKHIGCCRFIWNKMLLLQEYRHANKKNLPLGENDFLSGFDMCNLLVGAKEQYPWLNEVCYHSLQRTCMDLAASYKSFFRHKTKHPLFKTKKRSSMSYPINDGVKFKNGVVQIPKVGLVKYQTTYNMTCVSKISNPRISLNPNGKWLLTFGIECENQAHLQSGTTVGIDLGIKELAVIAVSSQENADVYTVHNLNKSKKLIQLRKKLKHYQRAVMRKYRVNGSYEKSSHIVKLEKKIQRLYFHISNIQKNLIHNTTSFIIRLNPDRVVMEDLCVKDMLKNVFLRKYILQQCFSAFIKQMRYKCEWNGIEFVQVGRYYPSSKTCHRCGYINKELKLSDRTYVCPACGFEIDRDVNAALNLMTYAVPT